MAYKSGTAFTPDQFVDAFLNFAVNDVARFNDPFRGSRGLSSFQESGTDVFSTFAIEHNDSGALFLFDIVKGELANNNVGEYVLFGQLLDSPGGSFTINYDRFFDVYMTAPSVNCTWTMTESAGVYTFIASMTGGEGALTSLQDGFTLVLIDQTTSTLRHIFDITTASVAEGTIPFTQTLTCSYVGSLDVNTGVVTSTPPSMPASGNQTNFLFSDFDTYETNELFQTRFGEFQGSMWNSVIEPYELKEGWFPRSGRISFTGGLDYEFFGGPEVGEEYFHMVLKSGTHNSHWWMGRTSSVGGPVTVDGSNAGVFLATTGPHTDAQGKDTFQYAMDFQNMDEVWKNPCVLLTPYENASTSELAIPMLNGGRANLGPFGVSHRNQYGPTKLTRKSLETTRYSIQTGLNGFEGGPSWDMDGARGRTIYPLRPGGSVPLNYDPSYIYPFTETSAIAHNSDYPETFSSVFRFWYLDEISTNWTAANSSLTYETNPANNGYGYVKWTFSNIDPYIVSNQFTPLVTNSGSVWDMVEIKFRLVSGPASAWLGQFWARNYPTDTGWPFSASTSAYAVASAPDGLADNEWVTAKWIVGQDDPLWYDRGNLTARTFNQIRFDLFGGDASATEVHIEYIAFAASKEALDARFGATYCHYLGQVPGVYRGTLQAATDEVYNQGQSNQFTVNTRYVTTRVGDSNYSTFPVRVEGAVGDRAKPPHLADRENSGDACYVYKR